MNGSVKAKAPSSRGEPALRNEVLPICDRCGAESDTVRDGYEFTDSCGEKVKMKLCWDCDWDVSNGGDPFEDETEIFFDRWENDYEYDPLNTPSPY